MDIFLLILGFVLVITGVLGSFLPVIPGPFTGWLGLLAIHFTDALPMNYWFLGITFLVSVAILVLDYVIPAMGTKRYGGTQYGVWGSMLGLVVGLIVPVPFGFIWGPFVGALIGEMIATANGKKALRAAWGSFLGFLAGTFMKFIIALVFVGLYFYKAWGIIETL